MPVEPLEYRPGEHRREAHRSLLVIVGLTLAGQLMPSLTTHRWIGLFAPLVGAVLYAALRWRSRRIVWRVDERGIHVPPRFDAPWSRIDSVVTPGPWHDAAHVRLAGSDDERPMGFPAQYAERIAKIGDKLLR